MSCRLSLPVQYRDTCLGIYELQVHFPQVLNYRCTLKEAEATEFPVQ